MLCSAQSYLCFIFSVRLSYVHHVGFVVGYLNQLMATGKLS
jgi:hypothetical protein